MANKNAMAKYLIPKRKISLSIAAVLAAMGATSAYGIVIDSGNPDIQMRWDNQVRYNAGWRMEAVNTNFSNSYGNDETELAFKKNDMVTNRFDLLSEFDFTYQNQYGFRVSGAAWSENAYGDHTHTNPKADALGVPSQYGPSKEFSAYAKRYATGSSGEFLDAFVFGKFNLGDTTLNLKVGQHNVYWGESLYSLGDSIAHGQGPVDTIKAATSPGSEAKELFLPLNQISASWTLTNELSLDAQYLMDWKPFRLTPGGDYFAAGLSSDGFSAGCAQVAPAGGCMRALSAVDPGRDGGDYGIALRWSPTSMGNSTMGVYYRKYDEKIPWNFLQYTGGGAPGLNTLGVRYSYARDTELFGFSLTTTVASVSTGIELSYRHNTALQTVNGFFAGTGGPESLYGAGALFAAASAAALPLTSTPSYKSAEGARGDTYHLLINGIYLLPKTYFWDSGTLQGELTYQYLDKVTKNANLFYSKDYVCKNGYSLARVPGHVRGKSDGCATKDAWGFAMGFTPQWSQVFPALDLSMPISYRVGLGGNAPAMAGAQEGSQSISIGLTATYLSIYEIGLAYNDSHANYSKKIATIGNGIAGQTIVNAVNGNPVSNNHGWLSLRFKTSF